MTTETRRGIALSITSTLFLYLFLSVANAQDRVARMPVRIVGDRLVVRCEVSTKFRRIPVNLLVDYERLCGLELHNQAANGIRLDADGGVPITIHLPGFNVVVDGREHGDEDFLNEMTKLYSRELGETACVGTIGSRILSKYHVTFDLRAGFIYLREPREKSGGPPEHQDGTFVTGLTLVNDQPWLPVRLADGRIMNMNITTSRIDSLIDADVSDAMGHPAGDVGRVTLKTLDLSKFVAFRPGELVQVHPDGAFGTIGLNLLRHLRIELDRENRFARIAVTAPAEFPSEELAYFRALLDEESEPIVAWLEKHSDSRLAREASKTLLGLLLDEGADGDVCEKALVWVDKTRIADLRATEALATMKELLETQRPDLAIEAGRIGIKSGRKDRYPESVHKLHAKVGELLLETTPQDAWEHLLSAAFGLPEDGIINLHLGRFYEGEKRYRRAMSRYIQAVITPEGGPQAIAGLERVQQAVGGEALSVDLVDKMISGKVHNFGAATKFEPDDETKTNRVVLAELFTNPHFGRPVREGWRSFAVGGAMGAEGLLSHFPRDRVVVISHHVPQPEPCALQTELSEHLAQTYRVDGPLYFVINGQRRGPGAGRWRSAEKIYEQNRAIVLEELARASDYDLTVEARVADGVVKGSVKATGPMAEDLAVQILLVERGVLYPGKAKVVVHRMVARGVLTSDIDGVPFRPTGGRQVVPFERSLGDVKNAHERYLTSFERIEKANATRLSTRIDPRQVSVVALIRDIETGEVLQARYADAEVDEKP